MRYSDTMRVRPIRDGAWGVTISGSEYVLDRADLELLAAMIAEVVPVRAAAFGGDGLAVGVT
jgi:hypothetical protein